MKVAEHFLIFMEFFNIVPIGTSIAQKVFLQRRFRQVSLLATPTSMVPHTYLMLISYLPYRLVPTTKSGCLSFAANQVGMR